MTFTSKLSNMLGTRTWPTLPCGSAVQALLLLIGPEGPIGGFEGSRTGRFRVFKLSLWPLRGRDCSLFKSLDQAADNQPVVPQV